jgi:hypothetical protein
MNTMTAAAEGQARLIAGGEGRGKRTHAEDQDQEDGEPTPHL